MDYVFLSGVIVIVKHVMCFIKRLDSIKYSLYHVCRCGSSRFALSALEMGEGMEKLRHFTLLQTHEKIISLTDATQIYRYYIICSLFLAPIYSCRSVAWQRLAEKRANCY